ncbi:MAG: FdhF/YdeP family oxidoreductase [Phycisphaerae bacterium]|nr:FdhF/YdeP family oxidoreductase [Phycisphaerae bacterium]
MRLPRVGGGWPSIWYTLTQSRGAGGLLRMWRGLRSKNACKTCALGMGGQRGGMVNETGHFPEVCKKSIQAMAADMRGAIREGFFAEFPFAKLGAFSPRELEVAGRITTPLYAGPGDAGYRAISWDEAIERTGRAFRAARPDETFFYASGRSSNEAGFLWQLVARVYGTNNVNNCSFFCHNASGVALKETLGSSAGTVDLDDLAKADLVVLVGANPASNHPRLMRTLMEVRRRGGSVLVVNPIREVGLMRFAVPSDVRSLLFGSDIADFYVQPHIGGDAALFSGVAKALVEGGNADRAFVERHTEGFATWSASIEALSWSDLVERSGVDEATIREIARRIAASKRTIFSWTMGITHHAHGVENVHAIVNVALLRGMLGRPGAGLLPLRGHSNVQGIGTIGVVPAPSRAFLDALESFVGTALPREPGLDTMACIERAAQGRINAALHLGGNLYGSAPDAEFTGNALRSIGLTVFLSTTLNTGHVHGRGQESIILPVRARDEEPQPTTQESMFSYVRLSDGGPSRFDGPRSEVETIVAIAKGIAGDRSNVEFDRLSNHSTLREAIAHAVPDLKGIATIDRTKEEFVVPGRLYREPTFPTPSGRAHFHVAAVPPASTLDAARGEFHLMTMRSEGQFNTVVYEDHDSYRGQDRRDIILMHAEDMQALGLRENDRVRVESECGAMDGILVRPFDIRRGNAAMYYPEANALVPAKLDPRSKTPNFKNVAVRVRASRSLPVMRPGA